MRIVDPIISVVVLVPFLLLTGYYLFSLSWTTLKERSELSTWEAHLLFAALLIAQLLGIAVVGLFVYFVIYAKFFA